jgi:hypothetical protein
MQQKEGGLHELGYLESTSLLQTRLRVRAVVTSGRSARRPLVGESLAGPVRGTRPRQVSALVAPGVLPLNASNIAVCAGGVHRKCRVFLVQGLGGRAVCLKLGNRASFGLGQRPLGL